MGFIKTNSSTTLNLSAYMTQKGREYLVNGDRDGFLGSYFALSDSDTNYLVASQSGSQDGHNVLWPGYVPDLSGDADGLVHSLAGGVVQRFTLYGGSNVGSMGTNNIMNGPTNIVRFGLPNASANLKRASSKTFGNMRFFLPVELLPTNSNSNLGVTGTEQVKIFLLPPSQGTSEELYKNIVIDNGGVVKWSQGEGSRKDVGVNFISSELDGNYYYTANFRVTPLRSVVDMDPVLSFFTVKINLSVGSPGGSAPSSSFSNSQSFWNIAP